MIWNPEEALNSPAKSDLDATEPRLKERPRKIFMKSLIPAWDQDPIVLAFASTWYGKAFLLFVFAILLNLSSFRFWPIISVILIATTFLPQWRRGIMVVGSVAYWLMRQNLAPSVSGLSYLLDILKGLSPYIMAFLYCHLVYRYRDTALFARPFLLLILSILVLAAGLRFLPQPLSQIIALVLPMAEHIWFIGYVLQARFLKTKQSILVQVCNFQPIWGRTQVPYAKGEAYLQSVEARDQRSLAITQIKAIKLMIWALLLLNINAIVHWALYGDVIDMLPETKLFRIPLLAEVLFDFAQGKPTGLLVSWLAVIANVLCFLLTLACQGHVIIAICRMSGFRALRNSYRPLESTSIAEFYNRNYYYFKEMLAEFFFYPTYFRYFKRWPNLRLCAATFAAAGLGNLIYHMFTSLKEIPSVGFLNWALSFRVYAFYCCLLGLAISISQWRLIRKPLRPRPKSVHVLQSTFVLLFYAVIMIFNVIGPHFKFQVYWNFAMHLFMPFGG